MCDAPTLFLESLIIRQQKFNYTYSEIKCEAFFLPTSRGDGDIDNGQGVGRHLEKGGEIEGG